MQAVVRCNQINCTAPSVAKGLCRKHYMRVKRHGNAEQTRPKDWGSKEKHELYSTWLTVRRNRRDVMCQQWHNDFWQFVKDIGSKPVAANARIRIERQDDSLPMGPGNWYWLQPKTSQDELQSKAEYMRSYQRKMRADNPRYFQDKDLQRHYGVGIEWYDAQYDAQGGVCAICGKPETLVIAGKPVKLAVDHDHVTGQVRGLLCSDHNRGLGMLGTIENLEAAIRYLRLHNPDHSW